jgi:hypothetical protein
MSNEQQIIQEWDTLQAQIEPILYEYKHRATVGELQEQARALLRSYAAKLPTSLGVQKGQVYRRDDDRTLWRVEGFMAAIVEAQGKRVIAVRTWLATVQTDNIHAYSAVSTPLLQQLLPASALPAIDDTLPRYTRIDWVV